ncbi:MAG: lambda exonuclease family protein [Pseudomonadota bacterium]
MKPEIIKDVDQGSAEWLSLRAGLPSASCFDKVMAKGRSGTASKTRQSYMNQLAGEIITGEPEPAYQNADMQRGHEHEPIARASYEFMTGNAVEQVAGARLGRVWCSPDGLIGDDGGYEAKSHKPSILIAMIEDGGFPPQHSAQVQGNLWVTGREWWDLHCFWPGMPHFIKRAYRDEAYIAELSSAVDRFLDELDAVVERIRRYGEAA